MYRDLDRPPLREAALRKALVDGGLWTEVRVVRATGSTNADVAAAAREGARQGLVLVAEEQTAGRGRLDRAWTAPLRSGLTFSVLLRPSWPRARWGWLPLLAGVSVGRSLGRLSGLDVTLKWPNDVLVGDRKLGGILAELAGDAVVIGIGLNVSLRAEELPVPGATSLALEGSEVIDRDPVLRAVLRDLAASYGRLSDAEGDPVASGLAEEYADACSTIGRRVVVSMPGGRTVQGMALEVDAEGRLVVEGVNEPLAAGDVVHVR